MSKSNSVPRDQIVCTEFDGGEGILVDLKTKKYYQLNETALLVWKGLEKGLDTDEIVSQVVDQYEVQPESARTSVENLIARLKSYRLVFS